MFRELDPLLHSELRLAIVSLLVGAGEAEFKELKLKTGATAGNLSVQVQKLADAGYIQVEKSFRGKYPLTTCKITKAGLEAFSNYVDVLKDYLKPKA
ncbi:transcriptional regulator [Arachidicoccus ginsenosidivorans]|jgi:DNA-binding transcriptional ArsR family regulator|uniref:Transcriptional regulator n=1 Tax=Arachidicoccus ginsenosidivorans TaxID=496057 RepID=A0A5B8VK67_9BACT|nr:transcriptional regulator [Arachidicoccus ginsenosidivorans]QEC71431.1 transcriptional regulator [Arachidicoccus ginsenosidivorans]